MKRYVRKLQIILLITMASCAVLFMVKRFFNSFEKISGDTIEISNSANKANSGFIFEHNNSASSRTHIQIDPKKTALYLNYFDSYECPYYTDRADLIAPEINRLAQMMRAFGMSVIFYTHTVPESDLIQNDIDGKEDEKLLMINEKPVDLSILKLDETSPKLEDKCLYTDYNNNPAPCNGTIHHDIKYSTKQDFFVSNHVHGVKLAKKLGIENLIVGGMRCNYWLPPFFEMLKNENIKTFYIWDLSDVAYFRASQLPKLDTHNKALAHFWTWVVKNYGATVNHFALIDRLVPKIPQKDFEFDGNPNAYYFYEYFGKDL